LLALTLCNYQNKVHKNRSIFPYRWNRLPSWWNRLTQICSTFA